MTLQNALVHIIDKQYSKEESLLSFVDANAILDLCNQTQEPYVHFWNNAYPTTILGINDKHLPQLSAGLQALKDHHYDYFLRNSGGLAVISDPGVLNVSLYLPESDHHYEIDEAYEVIKLITQKAFPELTIDSFEVVESYCPGKYDLSVNGQKIAGIAQRRSKQAMVLMLYLSVSGDQDARSRAISDLYVQGDAYSQAKWHFPKVNPQVMTNVNALGLKDITIQEVKDRYLAALSQSNLAPQPLYYNELNEQPDYQQFYEDHLRKMTLRNEQLPQI